VVLEQQGALVFWRFATLGVAFEGRELHRERPSNLHHEIHGVPGMLLCWCWRVGVDALV
jgi:hypothetical protein